MKDEDFTGSRYTWLRIPQRQVPRIGVGGATGGGRRRRRCARPTPGSPGGPGWKRSAHSIVRPARRLTSWRAGWRCRRTRRGRGGRRPGGGRRRTSGRSAPAIERRGSAMRSAIPMSGSDRTMVGVVRGGRQDHVELLGVLLAAGHVGDVIGADADHDQVLRLRRAGAPARRGRGRPANRGRRASAPRPDARASGRRGGQASRSRRRSRGRWRGCRRAR